MKKQWYSTRHSIFLILTYGLFMTGWNLDYTSASFGEAINIFTGRQILAENFDLDSLLNTGSPFVYPPLAAAGDAAGGLIGARAIGIPFGLLLTWIIYRTGWLLFSKKQGILSAIVFLFTGTAVFFSKSATGDIVAAAFLGLWFYLLLLSEKNQSGMFLLAGASALFLAFVTKYVVIIYVVSFIVFVLWRVSFSLAVLFFLLPLRAPALDLLARGAVRLKGRMPWSSNATFLVECALDEAATLAVYKPLRGERPLWDFPPGLYRREIAAYRLSEALGWRLVPPTIGRGGPLGEGSLQVFVAADFEQHYFTLLERPEHAERLRRMCTFDLLLNNADRKSGHCLLGEDGLIWAIDHGLSFHVEEKLRTVIWDFGGEPIPHSLLDDLRRRRTPMPSSTPLAISPPKWTNLLVLVLLRSMPSSEKASRPRLGTPTAGHGRPRGQ